MMMGGESSKARMIDELLKHLEGMDADHLQGEMKPKGFATKTVEIDVEPSKVGQPMSHESAGPNEKGPMEILMENGADKGSEMNDDDMTDEELEELENLKG